MQTDSGEILLGREHPSGVVRADINRLVDSHGGVLLIAGEAGIGKTTLAADAAEYARSRGVLVLGGSCWESATAPGYWPWVQVIRALRRSLSADEWGDIAAATGQSLGIILGEVDGAAAVLGSIAGESPFTGQPPIPATASTNRFQLADAVTTALVMATQLRPVMVVLDDLHWADPASLQLLEFAAQHTWFERLLLVGTYRDAEVDALDGAVRSLLAPIVAKANTVTLTGLSEDEVAALIARVSGRDPDPEIVVEVHRRTGGNPFFVEQTARLWQVGAPIGTVPPGVRDAVRRRVAMLPERLVQQLTAASVLGQEFDLRVLAGITATPVATVSDLLALAITARLVVPVTEGQYGFVHDLVRETLYGGLSEEDRRSRHATVVTVAQSQDDLRGALLPADLARHARLAADALDPDVTARLMFAAATDAESRLALQEAHDHFQHALDRVQDPVLRARIGLDFSHVLLHAGQPDRAERYLSEAAATALETNDTELMVRSALAGRRLAHVKPERTHGAFDPRALIREVHGRLVSGDAAARSEDEMVRNLIAVTEATARHEGNDEALTFSLWARHDAIWGLGTAAERLAVTSEMVSVGRRTGDTDTELYATSLSWVARLELGDPTYVDQLEAFVAGANRLGAPRYRIGADVDRSIIAAFRGDFAAAEAFLAAIAEHGDHGAPDFLNMRHHLRWALAELRGDFDAADGVLAEVPDGGLTYIDLLASITAVERAYAEQGWPDGSGRALTGTGIERARQYVRDMREAEPYARYLQPLWLRLQAEVAAATGDLELGGDVRATLEPHRGQWLVSIFGCDISGPVEHWIALLDLAAGRVDAAIASATAAVDAAHRLGSAPWRLAAQALLARAWACGGDHEKAARLAADVEREAAAIGMRQPRGVLRATSFAAARDPRSAPASVPPSAPPSAAAGAEFRRDGAVWRLGFAGYLAHLPDSKGLRDLHTLLSRPGDDVSAIALYNPSGGPEVADALSLGADDVLDEKAKAQYRARLATLDDELDRADARGDAARAAELTRERDALVAELRRAVGLGGRARRLGDESERARKAVTARIRDTLRKLDEHHPALAAHLRETVSTGATCRYAPAEAVNWRL